jgi:DNA polymerase III subunit delta
MRLKFEQLNQHLKQNLLPIYLVSGDEPLLVQEAVSEIRAAARKHNYEERQVLHVDRTFDWNTLLDGADALSLFASKKIIELKLGTSKPGTVGAKALKKYCERVPEDTLLIIEAGRLDKGTMNSKWVQGIDALGASIQIWPVSPSEMPRFMANRARQLNLTIEQDALSLLSSRLEGNLLAAKQELEKLALLHADETISIDMIMEEVRDSAKYDVFDLSDAALRADAAQCANIVSHLESEGSEPTIALWAMSKDLRVISELVTHRGSTAKIQSSFKQYRIIPMQQGKLTAAAQRLNSQSVHEALSLCKRVDDTIKGQEVGIKPWPQLKQIALIICGVKLPQQIS